MQLAKANLVSFDIFCLARQSLPRQILVLERQTQAHNNGTIRNQVAQSKFLLLF